MKRLHETIEGFQRHHHRVFCVATGDDGIIRIIGYLIQDRLQEELRVYEQLGDTRSRAVTLSDIARIRVDKGQVDEALKLHEERLRVFEQLGDTRERAVTLGDIARIRVDKGQVDEALKLHEEMLPIYEQVGDIVGKGHVLWSIANIQLSKENYQEAFEKLAESYNLLQKSGRLDGICMVGIDLGKLLCQAGHTDDGLQILTRSRDGFLQLGQPQMARRVEGIINQVGGQGAQQPE